MSAPLGLALCNHGLDARLCVACWEQHVRSTLGLCGDPGPIGDLRCELDAGHEGQHRAHGIAWAWKRGPFERRTRCGDDSRKHTATVAFLSPELRRVVAAMRQVGEFSRSRFIREIVLAELERRGL